jgi:hypothetical protein
MRHNHSITAQETILGACDDILTTRSRNIRRYALTILSIQLRELFRGLRHSAAIILTVEKTIWKLEALCRDQSDHTVEKTI